eukprot:CAMPEP_0114586660 /NCGR_PEP_ID=MMETSP0125-20121206/9816_1 /TAXON_ID=485358 ORGANISM="Aristerostoma sp., Strain ATCC 50986" /NCGR_SAMPLE_ID=MMETSP0125 /ASSEMBLY_ACC=CAM_ASM_000245 /LENGTH=436 /DNA_ID=CAMNT_0001782185 /DNA_START=199 /DNA_END=1509 /DNA_ORIENTATION=-
MIKTEITSVIEKQYPGQSETYFDLMYSLYSLPNIFLPIASGILIDRVGYNKLIVLFCGMVLLGNFIVYMGTKTESIGMLLGGRFIYGIGGESLGLGLSTLVITWFRGKELALSSAIALSFGRIGCVINCFISPHLVKIGFDAPYGLAIWICMLSFGAVGTLSVIDQTSSIREEQHKSNRDTVSEEPQPQQTLTELFQEIKNLKPIVGFHVLAIVMFFVSYLPFNMVASGFFLEKWFTDPNMPLEDKIEGTGELLSIPLIISSLFFPFFGYLADKIGYRMHLITIAAISIVCTYIFIQTTAPYIPLILLGLGYGIFGVVVWPVLVFLVPARVTGTIMGIVSLIQNLSMTFFPVILAFLEGKYESNVPGIYCLLFAAILTLGLVLIVWKFDTKNKVSVNSTDQAALVASVEAEYAPKKAKDLPLKDAIDNEEGEELIA